MFPPDDDPLYHLDSWVTSFDEYGLPVEPEAQHMALELSAQIMPAPDDIEVDTTSFTAYPYIEDAYAGVIPSYTSTVEDEQIVPVAQPIQNLSADQAETVDPVGAGASCSHAICHWRDETSGTQCDIPLDCGRVPAHFKEHHRIKNMHETEWVVCRWGNCFACVGRKNFVRHIRERHLGHSRDKGHST